MPLLDYSVASEESSYLEKLGDWLSKYSWAPKAIRALSISELVQSALSTRKCYGHELALLLESGVDSSKYERKVFLSRIKFYTKRLLYLATPAQLLSFSNGLSSYPELASYSMIMKSIYSRDVSNLLKFGTDAAQSAAQVLGIRSCRVTCDLEVFNEVELQSLAIFRLHGIDVSFAGNIETKVKEDPLNQFSLESNIGELMMSNDLFIRELACLRGMDNVCTHKQMIDTAFDRNEELSFSIIDQFQDSNYF